METLIYFWYNPFGTTVWQYVISHSGPEKYSLFDPIILLLGLSPKKNLPEYRKKNVYEQRYFMIATTGNNKNV
jgi:hypothetical protein